jgi:hypothetical protein
MDCELKFREALGFEFDGNLLELQNLINFGKEDSCLHLEDKVNS